VSTAVSGSTEAPRRQRNARGQGARLTSEIVSGALALIDRAGSDEAVTLRAVAREVGIAAPSIYAHFPDRDAIVMAVVGQIFDELASQIRRGIAAAPDDPVDRLIAGCEAYVAFGLDHPARYGVLFSGRRAAAAEHESPSRGPAGRPALPSGATAFALLVDSIEECVRAGASASTDLAGDATAVWVALHGLVSLRTALADRFPWPSPAGFVRGLVLTLARITTPAA
jgi:AcrR family transcriptional regulator